MRKIVRTSLAMVWLLALTTSCEKNDAILGPDSAVGPAPAKTKGGR